LKIAFEEVLCFFGLDASADPDPEATTPSADHGTANLDCTRSNGNAELPNS